MLSKQSIVEENYDNVDLDFHNSYNTPSEFPEQIGSFCSNVKEGGKILNIGGTLAECEYFRNIGLNVSNIDVSQAMLNYIRDNIPDVETIKGNIEDHANAKYDGIWACRSLFHITPFKIDDALANIRNLLKPNGTFGCIMFTSANGKVTEKEIEDMNSLINGKPTTYYRATYPAEVFEKKLREAGFKTSKVELVKDQDGDKCIYTQSNC